MRLCYLCLLYTLLLHVRYQTLCHNEAVSVSTERGDDVRDAQTAAEQNIPHTELVIDDSAKTDNLDDQVRAHYASRGCHLEFIRVIRSCSCTLFSSISAVC